MRWQIIVKGYWNLFPALCYSAEDDDESRLFLAFLGLTLNLKKTSGSDEPVMYNCCERNQIYSEKEGVCKPNPQTQSADVTSDSITFPQHFIMSLSGQHSVSGYTEPQFRFRTTVHLPSDTCTKGFDVLKMSLSQTTNVLTSRGDLQVGNQSYPPQEFCIVSKNASNVVFRVCEPTCSGSVPCIPKCCPLDELVDRSDPGSPSYCSPSPNKIWKPSYYSRDLRKPIKEEKIHPHYIIRHAGNPKLQCSNGKNPIRENFLAEDSKWTWNYRLEKNGIVALRKTRYTWKTLDEEQVTEFCIDGRFNTNYSGIPEEDVIVYCAEAEFLESSSWRSILYGVGMLISSVFTILTVTAHVVLWNKQKLPGWLLMSYSTSLFFLYILFAASHLLPLIDPDESRFCVFIGVCLSFVFPSVFCWITVINYDLWRTFSDMLPSSSESAGLKKYIAYLTFATLIPLLIASIGGGLQLTYGADYDSDVVVPDYQEDCNMNREYAALYYQYIPSGVLLSINVILFTVTAYKLYQAKRSGERARSSSTKESGGMTKLFGKLLIFAGIPWIFEVVSYLLEDPSRGKWVWVIVIGDLINMTKGILIFYLFVYKKDTMHFLEEKYPKIRAFNRTTARLLRSVRWAGSRTRNEAISNHTETQQSQKESSKGPTFHSGSTIYTKNSSVGDNSVSNA